MGKRRIENFLTPSRPKANVLCLPPHKSRNFSDPPPPVWIEKLTAMKQMCIAGKVRYSTLQCNICPTITLTHGPSSYSEMI
jgi:hypothetical protein